MMALLLRLVLLNICFIAIVMTLGSTSPFWLAGIAVGFGILLGVSIQQFYKQHFEVVRALEAGMESFLDKDFSISLYPAGDARYRNLIELFNQTAEKLRSERQYLYQRELLLDKVVNTSPVQTILINHRDTVIFANKKAMAALSKSNASLIGARWKNIISQQETGLQTALKQTGQSIYVDSRQQVWHLSCSSITLHGAPHQLFLLKPITEEFAQQELQVWKKVVRVMSHELNNSLAPISSMCHSGQVLAERVQNPQLDRVFQTISKRIQHLNEFVKSYSALAKVKLPNKSKNNLLDILQRVEALYSFSLSLSEQLTAGSIAISIDASQIEQVLINILKNAHEAQADTNAPVEVVVYTEAASLYIDILDQGYGIPEDLLQNVLLPFYSTKATGTGIGLAISREILEAHGGRMSLMNREQGGLKVTLELPWHFV